MASFTKDEMRAIIDGLDRRIEVTDLRPPFQHYDECPDSPTFGMPIGVKRQGSVTFTSHFSPNKRDLYESLYSSFVNMKPMTIVWQGYELTGIVERIETKPAAPGSFEATVTAVVRVTGAVPQKEKTKVAPKKVRFYIGKRDVCEGTDFQQWGKGSLPEALEQAKALAEKTDEPFYIVKVIKVVRRKKPPVTVEDVR